MFYDTDLMYLGSDFPTTASLSSSTAVMSECGTSNMGSRRRVSYTVRATKEKKNVFKLYINEAKEKLKVRHFGLK